jgi:probable rRNA maturation factor
MTVAVSNRQRLVRVNTRQLSKLAQATLGLLGVADNQLSIVLVTDNAIAKLNKEYHRTDGPTDTLSFDYGRGQGELVISVEHAVAQAKRFHTTPARELALYIVHGILHLHGQNDRTVRQRRGMRAAERRMLARLRDSINFGKLFCA